MLNCNFLSSRRIELGLSQIDIAKELGYSVQLISFWESGKNLPSLQILSKYASILQVDLEGIIYGRVTKSNDYSDTLSFDVDLFGKNLRHLRKKKKLTQKELAAKIDCPVNAIIRFEKGTSSPTIPQFLELCKIFNKSVDELYFVITIDNNKPVRKKKFFIPLPILIPILVVTGGGAITGTVIGVNHAVNNNKNHIENISSDVSTTSEHSSSSLSSSEPSSSSPSSSSSYIYESSNEESSSSSSHINESSNEESSSSSAVSSSDEYTSSEIEIISSSSDISSSSEPSSSKEEMKECAFGLYPQSRVNDSSLITILDGLSVTNSHGYYGYGDEQYLKATSHYNGAESDAGYYFDNSERISDATDYWFKVKPIQWDVISSDDEGYVLLSRIVLDYSSYGESNTYSTSSMRTWLNADFKNTAFYEVEDKLLTMNVDNSLTSTTFDINPYICPDTVDYVTLLSLKEAESVTRTASTSEYYRAIGGSVTVNKNAPYWTRTPSDTGSNYVATLNHKGKYIRNVSTFPSIGIRPIIKIKR